MLKLVQQKKLNANPPLTHSQFTQTNLDPIIKDDSELEPILDQLIKSIQQLNKQIK